MPEHQPEVLTEWVAPARKDPGQFVCRWKPLSPTIVLFSLLLVGGGYWAARPAGINGAIAYVLVCTCLGIMLTLAAMAWGATISLTESPKCGAWFVIFPPYMFYYAATRWRWMAQPTILFLCGLGLAFGGIFAGNQLLAQSAAP
jgi:hypothetical protein